MLKIEKMTLKPQFFIGVISIAIALVITYIQHGWINDDSVLYLEAAKLFSIGEWQEGWDFFHWPLYSILIALIHKATLLDIQTSAQLLNIIFYCITTLTLMNIIKIAGGTTSAQIFGALLLFSSNYITRDVLGMLMRDQGFWACFLLSIYFYIKFYQTPSYKLSIAWQAFLIFAILFRVEAVTFLCLPLTLFLKKSPSLLTRAKAFLAANTLLIGLIFIGLISFKLLQLIPPEYLGRVNEIFSSGNAIGDNFASEMLKKAEAMRQLVIGETFKEFTWQTLILSFIFIALIKSIAVAGEIPLIILAIKMKYGGKLMNQEIKNILLFTALLSLINAVAIIFKVNLLSSRYVIAFGFVIIIFAAFSFDALYLKAKAKNSNLISRALFMLLLSSTIACTFANLWPKKVGYNYEQDAVKYVLSKKSEYETVFYTTPRERYYAGEKFIARGYGYWDYIQSEINSNRIDGFDFLVIHLDGKSNNLENDQKLKSQLTSFSLEKTFYDIKHKNKILIYRKINSQ